MKNKKLFNKLFMWGGLLASVSVVLGGLTVLGMDAIDLFGLLGTEIGGWVALVAGGLGTWGGIQKLMKK